MLAGIVGVNVARTPVSRIKFVTGIASFAAILAAIEGTYTYFWRPESFSFFNTTKAAAGFVLGALSSFAASYFLAKFQRSKESAARRIRTIDREFNEIVPDESSSQIGESKSDRDRQIEAEFDEIDAAQTTKLSGVLRWFAVLGGLIGLGVATWQAVRYFRDPSFHSSIEIFVTTAFAATDGVKTELNSIIPYVAVGVLGLMGVSFLCALGTLLLVEDNKANQARIKSADNIVKTFGGFFTGLATTLLK